MGIKSRARAGDGGVSNQLSPDKTYSKRKDTPSNKGILRRVMGFFRYRFIGVGNPIGRIYADPEFFDTGTGFIKSREGQYVYRGQMNKWKRNGHGILISRVDGFRFEGEFKDNLPNGKGKEIEADGRVIEGNWVNGKPSGRATAHYPDGSIYVGNFKRGIPHGKGLMKMNDELAMELEGNFKDGFLAGPGVIRNKFGITIEGSFINGNPNPHTEHKVTSDVGGFFFKGQLNDDTGWPGDGTLYNTGNGVEFYTGDCGILFSPSAVPETKGTIFYEKIPFPDKIPFPPSWISYTGEMLNLVPSGYGELTTRIKFHNNLMLEVLENPSEKRKEIELTENQGQCRLLGNFVDGEPVGEVQVTLLKQVEGGDYRDEGVFKFRQDKESGSVELLSISRVSDGISVSGEQAQKVQKIIEAFIDQNFIIPKENLELVGELIEGVFQTNNRNMLPGGIEQLLRDDEGQKLEFKASIWSNYNSRIEEFIPRGNGKGEQKDKNWNLQDSVIKTIAGFRNAEGGTLLIGVEDKVKKSKGKLARVLGIQSDFRWTKNEDRESYDHALREAIRESMSDKLVELHSNDVIKITYPEFDGKEICRVDVKGIPHGEEGHIWAKTKNLGKDTFFVRSSDSTRPLTGSEAHEYILGRLKKKRYE